MRPNQLLGSVPRLASVLAVVFAAALAPSHVDAQAATASYTEQQAAAGQQDFVKYCADCHEVSELTDDLFRSVWDGKPLFELFDVIKTTMPEDDPGILSREQYAAIVAYLLKLNQVPAGPQPVASDDESLQNVKVALSGSTSAVQLAKREAVVPEGARLSGNLTPGIRYGNVVYASGQLGVDPNNPNSTIQDETRRALEGTKRVFEAAGTTMDQALKCTVFLVNASDFNGMNEAYREFFPEVPPARSTVVVAALVVANAKVEIECMAAVPLS